MVGGREEGREGGWRDLTQRGSLLSGGGEGGKEGGTEGGREGGTEGSLVFGSLLPEGEASSSGVGGGGGGNEVNGEEEEQQQQQQEEAGSLFVATPQQRVLGGEGDMEGEEGNGKEGGNKAENGNGGGVETGEGGGGGGAEMFSSPPLTPQPKHPAAAKGGGGGIGGMAALIERALTPVTSFRLSSCSSAATALPSPGVAMQVEGGREEGIGEREEGNKGGKNEEYPLFLEQGMLPVDLKESHPGAFLGGGGGGGREGGRLSSPTPMLALAEGEVDMSRQRQQQQQQQQQQQFTSSEESCRENLDEAFPDVSEARRERGRESTGWANSNPGQEDAGEQRNDKKQEESVERTGEREHKRTGSFRISQPLLGAAVVATASVLGGMMLIRKSR